MPIPLRPFPVIVLGLCVLCFLPSAYPQSSSPPDPKKLVQIDGFKVNGSRIPAESIIRLSGLKVGQTVNYSIINAACHKITTTGLVKMINYGYDVAPGEKGIILSFNVVDEMPLLPARIVPAEDADKIWGCLQTADPIFTRELPNTRAAMDFYSANIERCIEVHGQQDAYVHATVPCDRTGKPAEILFDIRPKQP
jgi:hypothetical protein